MDFDVHCMSILPTEVVIQLWQGKFGSAINDPLNGCPCQSWYQTSVPELCIVGQGEFLKPGSALCAASLCPSSFMSNNAPGMRNVHAWGSGILSGSEILAQHLLVIQPVDVVASYVILLPCSSPQAPYSSTRWQNNRDVVVGTLFHNYCMKRGGGGLVSTWLMIGIFTIPKAESRLLSWNCWLQFRNNDILINIFKRWKENIGNIMEPVRWWRP